MNKLPTFHIQKDTELLILWKYISHGPKFVWMERLGDGFSKKLDHEEYLGQFQPVRSLAICSKLLEICEKERGIVQDHIYDLFEQKGTDGSWFKLYRTTIHAKQIVREHIFLKDKSVD